jgi:hypothetical protein
MMTLDIIGGEREALTFSGEVHKKAIRNYLESQGYTQTTDSYVEGHLADMVFHNSEIAPGKEFWIESKATEVGISEKKFSHSILEYFKAWVNLPIQKRFILWIFPQKVSREKRWREIFEVYNHSMIDDWFITAISHCVDDEKQFFEKIDKKEILSFFQNSKVTIGLASKLNVAAEEKRKTSSSSPIRKANALLIESEKRNHLIEEKCLLITNLLQFQYPRKIVKFKTKCQTNDELRNLFPDSFIPPYMFKGGNLYSFCDLEDLAIFKDLIVGKGIELSSEDFLSSNKSEFLRLMNLHIEKYARCRGLRKSPPRIFFFGLKPNEHGDLIERKKISYTGLLNSVAKPMYDKIDDKKLNFVQHKGVILSTRLLWNKPYITILPLRHFTTDGKTAIDGINKDRLDRKYRNPAFNRSDVYLRFTQFWKFCLFEEKFENPTYNDWFKNFNFFDLESFSIRGIPKSIDKNQSVLFTDDGGD